MATDESQSPEATCSEAEATPSPATPVANGTSHPNGNSNSSSSSSNNNSNNSSKKEKPATKATAANGAAAGTSPVYHTPGSNMKLIKLVRKEPCLWDPRHLQYRDSARKDKCWEEIARQVAMEIGHARQRWKSLRDTFTKKVRKIAIIEAAGGYTGSGEDPCQWKYFQQLKFLENVIHTQRPRLQPANGSGQTQPVKNALALSNLTVSINPLDCDEDDEEDLGPQRSWPLNDERELIHYMRDYPLLWNRKDPSFKNDASRDMAIIQIHTNFQERYTWSEIQNKINVLVKKYHEGDNSWMHQEALSYITNCSNGVKSEPIDSDECSADCNSLMPQIEMEEGEEVKSVTVSTTTNADGCPTVKVISTSVAPAVSPLPQKAAHPTQATAFTIQGLQSSLQNGQTDASGNQSAPIKIITVAPNSAQNFALGGAASNGGTILIPSGGQGILQMLQASKSSAQCLQDSMASTTERRIESFTSWIKAYLGTVETDDLDKIELEIHELMVRHTKRSKDRKSKSRTPRQPSKKPHLENGLTQEAHLENGVATQEPRGVSVLDKQSVLVSKVAVDGISSETPIES
ncbi:uncharacterized protein LOC114828454 [Galendromus occidentalis]|uniref:Uncharacterized protein LOC114828454 n=1 Tax=Galendromus occidentalis TaxID=34638 RepID=A0AAJ7SI60_9ACAR|nr:uncharacterized protein LOC114828454 [Galendromus occidentalis]